MGAPQGEKWAVCAPHLTQCSGLRLVSPFVKEQNNVLCTDGEGQMWTLAELVMSWV